MHNAIGHSLHVRTCRVTLPDLENGRADYTQIWHTAIDQRVGCRARQFVTHRLRSARARLILSFGGGRFCCVYKGACSNNLRSRDAEPSIADAGNRRLFEKTNTIR